MEEEGETPLSFLQSSDDQVVKEILPYLTGKYNKKDLDENKKHNLTFFIMVFRDSYPTIFYLFIDKIQSIAEEIGLQMIHSLIGPEIVSFFSKIPPNFWKQIEIDKSQLPVYFNFPQSFNQIDSINELQKVITDTFAFPEPFPYVENAEKLSLVNSSITKGRHFVDIIFSHIFDSIVTGDYNSVSEQCSYLPELSAYFICSQKDILYADLSMCIELFAMQHPKSIASEMLERFKGDYEITQMLSYLANADICTGDIAENSIPLILSDVLIDPSVHQFKMPPSFIISDKDGSNDMDFIEAFWAIKSTLDALNKPSALHIVDSYLAKIKDSEIREKIIIDIFSLMFTQNEENYFVCVPMFVDAMLTILLKYSKNEYIAAGHALLSSAQPKTMAEIFSKDRSGVFTAMDQKDWDQAYALAGHTKYRKFVDLAKEVHLIVTNGETSTNKMALLESGLCTFSKWSEIEAPDGSDEIVVKLLKKRSKATSGAFDVLPETEKWTPSVTFVEMFETDGLEMIASGHADLYMNTIRGEHLKAFIKYCSLYYKCSALSNFEFNSLSSGFEFDMVRVLSGPVNCGSIDVALELAEACGIDLFSFIISHQSAFNITTELINYFSEKYPMETSAIAFSSDISEEEFSKLDKVPEIMKEAKRKKAVPNYDNLDDVLYNEDHHEVLSKLLQKDIEDLTDEDMYVLDIVSYAAETKEEENSVEMMKLKNVIYKEFKFVPKTSIEIVERLMFMKLTNKAITYAKNTNDNKTIIKLVEICPKDLIDEVLSAFSSKVDLFIPLCITKPHLIRSVLKFASGKSKDFLQNLSLLPLSVVHCYNDKEELVKFFSQSLENVLTFRKEFLNFVGDDEIFEICKSFANDSQQFIECIQHMLKFMTDKSKVSKWWQSFIIEKSKQKIQTQEDEEKLINFFFSIEQIIALFASNKLNVTEVRIMHNLVTQRIFSRIGPYEFSPETLMTICNITDNEECAIECSKLFSIPLGQFYLQRAHACLILGLYDTARGYVDMSGLSVSAYKPNKNSSLRSLKFLYPLNFPTAIDSMSLRNIERNTISSLKKAKLPEQKVYSNIYNTYKNILKPNSQIKKRQNLEEKAEIRYYMTCSMDLNDSLRMLTLEKQYDRVYQLLMSITDPKEKAKCFINDIFFVAATIENELNSLVNFFLSQDQTLLITRDLWDSLIEYTKQREMLHTLFFIHMFLNNLEDVANTSIELMKTAHSVEETICLLGHANFALTECEICRKKNIPRNPPYIPSSDTLEHIMQQKQIVDLLLKFYVFCASHKDTVEYSNKYDILHNENAYSEIMFTLINETEDDLIEDFMETSQEICFAMPKVYEKLATLDNKSLMRIVNHFKKSNISPDFFENLTTGMMKSISMTKNWSSVMSLILISKKDPREQCELFIEYNFLAEAYQQAQNYKMEDLYPLIAHKAAQLGYVQIYENCINNLM